MSLIISPVDSGETFYQKPSGLSQMFIKSRVDSRKCLSKAEWILTSLLSKAKWILANVYQKPSGFSQMSYQAEWILANLVLSPADSGETFYETEWISSKHS